MSTFYFGFAALFSAADPAASVWAGRRQTPGLSASAKRRSESLAWPTRR
jgi:hypothetical protein